jgi:hypothetical protein
MKTNGEKRTAPGVDLEKGTISYDYIKGNDFRVIHVDGVWGGNAPNFGRIHMAVFSERWPIPKRTVNRLIAEGTVGEEIFEERITRNAVVREIEVNLVMDIDTATVMRDWLTDKINKYQQKIEEHKTSKTKGED